MRDTPLPRRAFLGGTAAILAGGAARTASATAAEPLPSEAFEYEITRSDAEWKDQLSDLEHFVLREGGTETPRTSPLWNSQEVGTYCCKGCDLTLYDSLQKIELDKGWVFFRHSHENAVLTGLDLQGGMADDPFAQLGALLEVHCRRCGSHLGHIVAVDEVKGRPIHCINGTALNFIGDAA